MFKILTWLNKSNRWVVITTFYVLISLSRSLDFITQKCNHIVYKAFTSTSLVNKAQNVEISKVGKSSKNLENRSTKKVKF